MKTTILLLALALTGCETGHRSNSTLHSVEKWSLTTNSAGRVKRFLVFRERWIDRSGVRFTGLLTDPAVQGWSDASTNQTALGGGWRISFGGASSKTDSAGIMAAGSAVGNVVGAAVKTAVKP